MNRQRLSRLTVLLLASFIIAVALGPTASADGKEKVLYSFQGGTNDGEYPAGGVVFDKAGNLYGATTDGGGECPPAQCGTVFQLALPAQKGDPWTETVLYVFKGNSSGDGNTPAGSVIIDSAGNLYGTTGYGGTGDCVLLGTKVGCGTIYELSPPAQKGGAWTETVLYSFPTAKQGYLPNGNLVFDSVGNLYGATMFGGGYGTTCDAFYQYCGAVFELSLPKKKGGKWTEKVLHSFRGIAAGADFGDGANPIGGFALDSTGAIYGATSIGGLNCPHSSNQGCGTVFKLAPPGGKGQAWTEQMLIRFNSASSGAAEPSSGVILDKSGNLYSTTVGGGRYGEGTVFKLAPHRAGTWKEEVLYSFHGQIDGANPQGGVVLDARGTMYGTSEGGMIFSLRYVGGSWVFALVYDFKKAPDGWHPTGPLVFDAGGSLFGTTQWGGTGQSCQGGCGTVYTAAP
jgi:uncharacterized repeat protein (TIGR03803 family)